MRTRILLLAAAAVMLDAEIANAQATPNIVLVHGFHSGPWTWTDNGTLDSMRNQLIADVQTVQYDWTQRISVSAPTIAVPEPASSILVGHSEGGIVSRQRAVNESAVLGVLTVGSPNKGANMADNYWHFTGHVAYTAGDAWLVWRDMWAIDAPDAMVWVNYVYDTIDLVLGSLEYLVPTLNEVIAFTPVVADLRPSSPYISDTLNDLNLETERAHAPTRVSMYFTAPIFYIAPEWRVALGEEAGTDMNNFMLTIAGYSDFISQEAMSERFDLESCGPDCDEDGTRWSALSNLEFNAEDLAQRIWLMDLEWCADVSLPADIRFGNPPPDQWCVANDGFIRTDAHLAPQAEQAPGPFVLHTEEPAQAGAII